MRISPCPYDKNIVDCDGPGDGNCHENCVFIQMKNEAKNNTNDKVYKVKGTEIKEYDRAWNYCEHCYHKWVCKYKEEFDVFNNLVYEFVKDNMPKDNNVRLDLHCEYFHNC